MGHEVSGKLIRIIINYPDGGAAKLLSEARVHNTSNEQIDNICE